VEFRLELKEIVMKKLAAILAIVLALGLVVSGCPGDSGQSSLALGRVTGIDTAATQPPKVGELASDFYFETPEGEASSISQLSGTPVMLNFWATWCTPCRHEMPFLQQLHEEGDELVMLTVNVGESSSDVSQFMQDQGFSFPVLLDSNGKVARRYNVTGIPTTFFIDSYGVIQAIKIGAFQSQTEIENILSQLD
jgi:thiol-disulfide isomerase/thioredoxin